MTTFHVPTTLAGFPAALGLPATTTLSFDGYDLAWSLFVTGRAPGDAALHGLQSFWEFLHRVTLVPAYIRVAGTALTRSALALDLDRSEKVNLSYSLGQAMAGVFAGDVLGVTRLMHVDRYEAHHTVVFAPGKERPDLFGQASSGWVVIEAKGRSRVAEAALWKKLQKQKSMGPPRVNARNPTVCICRRPLDGGGQRGRRRGQGVGARFGPDLLGPMAARA